MASDHYFLELEPPEGRLRPAHHGVIVSGGFAGIQACRALAKSEVRITPARARGKATKRANVARRSHSIHPK